MKEYNGLKHLKSVGSNNLYCPKCGNPLKAVMNGFFHGEVFYCPKENKVFIVQIREKKEVNEEFLKQKKERCEIEKVRKDINKENYQDIKNFFINQ